MDLAATEIRCILSIDKVISLVPFIGVGKISIHLQVLSSSNIPTVSSISPSLKIVTVFIYTLVLLHLRLDPTNTARSLFHLEQDSSGTIPRIVSLPALNSPLPDRFEF